MADVSDSSHEHTTTKQDATPSTSESIKLAVFCPQRPLQRGETAADVAELHTLPQKVEVASSSTVSDIKQKLELSFPGGPLAKGQTLLWHGRRLSDDEVIQQVVQGTQQPEMGYALHLTCPADMWKAATPSTSSTTMPPTQPPFKTPSTSAAERLSALSSSFMPPTPLNVPLLPQLSTSFTANTLLDTLQPSPSLDTTMQSPPSSINPKARTVHISSEVRKTFNSHFSVMSTSQRADLMGRLSRAERYYATLAKVASDAQGPQMRVIGPDEVQHLRETGQIGTGSSSQSVTEMEESIEQLLEDLGVMQSVRLAQIRAAEDVDAMEKTQISLLGGQTSSRVVYISGYPFLLQIPPQFAVSAKLRKEAFVQMRKYQAIGIILNALLGFARTMQSAQQVTGTSAFAGQYQIPLVGRARDAYQTGGQMPPVAGIAMQQGLNRPNGLGAVGIGAQAAGRIAGPGMPTARLAVVINLDEIMALAMPLLFLSVKLGFLIYVFGKHATYRKRLAMCAMAFAWVVWEGMTIHRRRRAVEIRRQQQRAIERAQNRQADAQPGLPNGAVALEPPLDLNGQPQGPQAGNGQLGGQQNLPPALHQLQERLQNLGDQNEIRRRHRNGEAGAGPEDARRNGRPPGSSSRSAAHRQPPSRLSPKYWLYMMAKVGLSAEARDMGLSRSVLRQMQQTSRQAPQNSTPAAPLPAQANAPSIPNAIRAYQSTPLTTQRALRNLYIGVVLFIGTLIPEVERLRKKALLKREKKLAELELTRRQMHLASLQAELKTLEEERKSLEDQMAGAGNQSTSQSTAAQQGSSSSDTARAIGEGQPTSNARASGETVEAKRTAGLGIDALQQSDSDTDLFDPPMQKDAITRALRANPSDNNSTTGSSSSANGSADSASAANGSAGPPRIHIDTDAAARPNDLLSPLRALQRRDENGNLVANEDDYSAPSTPLLSPAMTEDEDDRQEDGNDEDVGMILF